MQKVALVTGSNKGLGSGFVSALLEKGYIVYATSRSKDPGLTRENLYRIELDLENDSHIENLPKEIIKNGHKLDLLINNAGLSSITAADDPDMLCVLSKLDRASLNRMFDVNATAQILVIKNLLSVFSDNAKVINISSNRGSFHDESPNRTANYGYRASKAALNMLTLAVAQDLPEGVGVAMLHPGRVRTEMNPSGTMEPKEAANKIIDNIVDNWKPEFNGAFLKSDGSTYPF